MKGYKTLLYAAAVAVSGFLASPEVTAWAADHAGWVTTVIGAGVAILRLVTNGPVLNR